MLAPATAARLHAVGLGLHALALDEDLARIRAHLDDGDPAVRKHAREWLARLEAERQVLDRWQHELFVPPMLCAAEPCPWPPEEPLS